MPSTGTPLEVSWEPETTTVPLLTNATSPGPGYPLAPAAEDHNNSSYQSPIPPNHDRVVMFPPTAACQGSDRGRRLANFGRIQRSNKYHRLWLVGSVLGFIPVRGSWRRTNSSVTAHSFSPAPSRRPEFAPNGPCSIRLIEGVGTNCAVSMELRPTATVTHQLGTWARSESLAVARGSQLSRQPRSWLARMITIVPESAWHGLDNDTQRQRRRR